MPELTIDPITLANRAQGFPHAQWTIDGWPAQGASQAVAFAGRYGISGTLDADGHGTADLPTSLDGTYYVLRLPDFDLAWAFRMPDKDSSLGAEAARFDPLTNTQTETGPTGPPGGYAFFASQPLHFPPVTVPTAKASEWTVQLGAETFTDPILAGTPFLSSYSGFVKFDADTNGQYDFTLRIRHRIGDVEFLIERTISQRVVKAETFTLALSDFESESEVNVGPFTDANGDVVVITEALLEQPVTCTFELAVTEATGKNFAVEAASIGQAKAWFSQQAIGIGGLEPLPGVPGVGIATVTEAATGELTIILTDGRRLGPFTLPQGPQGASVYDIYKVVADSAIPTDAPVGGSFRTTTQVLVPPSGWSLSPSEPDDGEVLIASRAQIDPVGQGTTIVPVWSVPFKAGGTGPPGNDGKDGAQGISQLTIWRKQPNGTTPATPQQTTWTLYANGDITFVVPSNWAATPPDPPTLLEPNARIFTAVARVNPKVGVGTRTASWSAPIPETGRRGRGGKDGTDGSRGSRWYFNSGNPISGDPAGVRENDGYLNTANFDVWRYDNTSDWIRLGSLKGPKGDPGDVADIHVSAPLTGDSTISSPITVAPKGIDTQHLADNAVTVDVVADNVAAGNPSTDSSAPVLTSATLGGIDYRLPQPDTDGTGAGGAGERTVLATLDKSHASANAELFQAHAIVNDLHHGELVTFVLSMVQVSTSESWAVFGSRLTQGDVPTTDPTGTLTGTDWRRVGGQTFRARDTPALEVDGNNSAVMVVEAVWNGADGADSNLLLGCVLRSLGGTTAVNATLAIIRAVQAEGVKTATPVGQNADGALTILPLSIHDTHIANAQIGPGKLKPKATYEDSKTVLRGGDNVTVTADDTGEQIVIAAQQSGRPAAPDAEGSFWGRAVGQTDLLAVPLKLRAIDSHDQRNIQNAYGYEWASIADQEFSPQSGNDYTRMNFATLDNDPGNYDAARPGFLQDRTHNQANPNNIDYTNSTAGTTTRVMQVRLIMEVDNQRSYSAGETLTVWIRANNGSRIRTPDVNTVARQTFHFSGGDQEPFVMTFDLEYTNRPRTGTADGFSVNYQFGTPSEEVVGWRMGTEIQFRLPALGAIPTQPLTAAAESTFHVPGDRSRGIIGWHVPDTDDHTGRNAPGESDKADIHLVKPAGWPSQADSPFLQAAQDLQQVRITMSGNIASDGHGSSVLLMHQSPAAGIGPTILATVPHPASGAFALDHTQHAILEGDLFWIALSGTGLGQGTQTLTWDANLTGGQPILNTVIAGVIHTVSEDMATGSAEGQQVRTHTWAASDYPALIEAARSGHLEELRIWSNGFYSFIRIPGFIPPTGADPVNAASRSQPLWFGLYARSSQNGGSYEGRLGANFWLDDNGLNVRFQSVGTQQPQVWIEQIEIDYLA